MKKCENNVKLANHMFFSFSLYYFHIIFTFLGPEPGPGPKAAAGQARPGPRAAALGPRPGSRAPKCENNMKKYGNLQAAASAADLSEVDSQMIGGTDALMMTTTTMRSQFR